VTAVRFHAAGQAILLSSAVIQTVPRSRCCASSFRYSRGTKPALAALCLYSLLPVVLNTFTGIRAVNRSFGECARIRLNRRQVLFRVVLRWRARRCWRDQDRDHRQHRHGNAGRTGGAAVMARHRSGLSLNDVPPY